MLLRWNFTNLKSVHGMAQGLPVRARAGTVQVQRDRHYQELVDRLMRTDLGDDGAVQKLIEAVLARSPRPGT